VAKSTPSLLTLPAALNAFVVASGVLFGVATVFLVFDRARIFQTQALTDAVEVRGQHAAKDLAESLNDTWLMLGAIREKALEADPLVLSGMLTAVVGDGLHVSWAGFADPNGKVLISSNDLLRGVDVSSRPWFQRGLSGSFAGDVHEAVLLNDLLGGSQSDPFRFIDLSTPVVGTDGNVDGVIGFHIDFAWAEVFLSETANELGLDLFLVNQAGELILSTDPAVSGTLRLQAFRAAAAGVSSTTEETWPDGVTYFSTVIPEVRHDDLPSFGWRMVARIAPTSFDLAQAELLRSVLIVLSAAGLVLLLMSTAFSRWFLRPFNELAENARRIAEGSDEYPFESRRTAELAKLSAALAQMQARDAQGGVPIETLPVPPAPASQEK
jgi:HAMP domain